MERTVIETHGSFSSSVAACGGAEENAINKVNQQRAREDGRSDCSGRVDSERSSEGILTVES